MNKYFPKRQLAVLLLAAILLTTVLPGAARAVSDWENLVIQVSRSGEVFSNRKVEPVIAQPVPGDPNHAHWVTLDPSWFGSMLQVEVLYPDEAYSFYFGDWTLNHLWEVDALGFDPVYAQHIGYSVGDMYTGFRGTIPIYFSTLPMPEGIPDSPAEIPTDMPIQPPTEAPTSTQTQAPTPEPAREAVIPVYYYHVDGRVLDFYEVTLGPGTHGIQESSSAIHGLKRITDAVVYVTVYPDGATDTASVAFYYEDPVPTQAPTDAPTPTPTQAPTPEPAREAVIPVYYYHVDGRVLDYYEVTLGPGTHGIQESSSAVQGLKRITDAVVYVTVYPDGATDTASVAFYYEDAFVNPVEAELTVMYVLEDGTTLDSQIQYLTPGYHTVYPGSSKVQGLTLTGDGSCQVYVDDGGAASPNPVVFVYRQAMAAVTVHYQDHRGRDVAPAQVRTLPDGVHVITATPEGLAANLELAPGLHTEVEVTVSGGVPSQSDVYFYYQEIPAEAASVRVTIHYYDTLGNEIATPMVAVLKPGKHRLTPAPVDLPDGYELASESSIIVEVFENGTFTPQEVAFYYREEKAEPLQADITVYYRDDTGRDIADPEIRSLTDGKHVIQPNPDRLPDGYAIFPGTDEAVEVTVRNGVANKLQVVFYYQQKPFVIPIYYLDTEGRQIATTQTVEIAAGTYSIKANPVDLPQGYELMMDASQPVTVFADGTTDPEMVAFYYRPPVKSAVVTVTVKEGSAIVAQYSVELAGGRSHTLEVDPDQLPPAFDPASAGSTTVFVSRDGVAEPASVTFQVKRLVVETPIPVGEPVYRYATVKSGKVAFRAEPSTAGGNKTVIKRFSKNDVVYVLQETYNAQGETWALINYQGREGYMASQYLDIMTQAQSDAYVASTGATMAPTFTPVPSPTPTASPSPTPTASPTPTLEPIPEPSEEFVQLITPPPADTPTLEPLPTATATPTASPSPTPYIGYALTTRSTALRTGVSSSDMTIIHNMQANELVLVSGHLQDPATGEAWSIVTTLRGQYGYVQNAVLRYITEKEAQPYLDMWEQINATAIPTQPVTPSPEPMQVQGYGVAVGDNVPFRQMASEYSRIIDNLYQGEVVYISGQTWVGGVCWHSVTFEGDWGYIRSDLVRLMTIAEEDAYLDSLFTPAPTLATTNQPFDANGLSSYGYVTASSVNFREEPSVDSRRVGELKRYAFCLVLNTQTVDGVTWYNVTYGGKAGYVHGDYFNQMTITELESFLGSEEYLQGIQNNTASGGATEDDLGFTGPGGLVSAEDQTVNQWQDPNSGVSVSYAPFNPIATVAPIVATPTLEPLPGATEVPTASPSPTPTFNPLPDIVYPTDNGTSGGSNGSALVWTVVISLLLIAVGGAFVIVRHQQKRRRIAMRAAQRRAQAARAQQQRPYARQAGEAQPRMGAYPNQNAQSVRRPVAQSGEHPAGAQRNPYASSGYGGYYRNPENAYARQSAIGQTRAEAGSGKAEVGTDDQPTRETPRVGRRSAYRQSLNMDNDNG